MEALIGELVTLRALRKDFFAAYARVFSATIQQVLHVSGVAGELDYLQNQLTQQCMGNSLFYCMFANHDDVLIGAIAIRDMQYGTGGNLYNWVNESYWGRGYYQEALRLMVVHYFACTENRYFQAYVDVTNKRSYCALKKVRLCRFWHAAWAVWLAI